jgi:hypothetical protein
MEGNMGMITKDDRSPEGWRKSPYSNNGGNCVEIAVLSRDQASADCKAEADRLFVMRDSKNPAGPGCTSPQANGTPSPEA